MANIPLCNIMYRVSETSQVVVWDFFQQQYLALMSLTFRQKNKDQSIHCNKHVDRGRREIKRCLQQCKMLGFDMKMLDGKKFQTYEIPNDVERW